MDLKRTNADDLPSSISEVTGSSSSGSSFLPKDCDCWENDDGAYLDLQCLVKPSKLRYKRREDKDMPILRLDARLLPEDICAHPFNGSREHEIILVWEERSECVPVWHRLHEEVVTCIFRMWVEILYEAHRQGKSIPPMALEHIKEFLTRAELYYINELRHIVSYDKHFGKGSSGGLSPQAGFGPILPKTASHELTFSDDPGKDEDLSLEQAPPTTVKLMETFDESKEYIAVQKKRAKRRDYDQRRCARLKMVGLHRTSHAYRKCPSCRKCGE